ncbi:MAG: hypothetical protein ACYDAG_03960 [Chloroflexota bacterium]
MASGSGPDRAEALATGFGEALAVQKNDDIFAQFVESSLANVSQVAGTKTPDTERYYRTAAWRNRGSAGRIPAERLVDDLERLIPLKGVLTRRQWTVLVEALLRLGLSTHVLWLCRLNAVIWELSCEAVDSGTQHSLEVVETRCWSGHNAGDPLLELGHDANATIKNRIQRYVTARVGLNLLLHALEDAGQPWQDKIGVSDAQAPAMDLTGFLAHVVANRTAVAGALQAVTTTSSLRAATNLVVDANPRLLNQLTGFPKNLLEFVRYTLVQLQARDDELKSYDQAYLLYRRTRASNSPLRFQPGPAALILLVHACCASMGAVPASLDDFKWYLGEYGVRAPSGELQGGQTARDLERLGLVVDSPDAGGGRLLVDPF